MRWGQWHWCTCKIQFEFLFGQKFGQKIMQRATLTHTDTVFFFFLMDTDTLLCTDFNRSGLLNCILYEYIIHSSLFVIIFIGPHPNPFYWPPPPISNGSLSLLTYFVPFHRVFPSNKLVHGES